MTTVTVMKITFVGDDDDDNDNDNNNNNNDDDDDDDDDDGDDNGGPVYMRGRVLNQYFCVK